MPKVSSIVTTHPAVMVLAAMLTQHVSQHPRSTRRWPFPSPTALIATPTAEVVWVPEQLVPGPMIRSSYGGSCVNQLQPSLLWQSRGV